MRLRRGRRAEVTPHAEAGYRLGVRGRVGAGDRTGQWVLVDVAGMTPLDPLIVVTSVDLDVPGHASEHAEWVNPEDLDAYVDPWQIQWTDVQDDATGPRFGP